METRLVMEPLREQGAILTAAARLEGVGRPKRLWWTLPVEWRHAVTGWADPFVIGMLFPMMQAGRDVQVEGRVSPSLLANLQTFMAIWAAWLPQSYRRVEIRGLEEVESPCPRAEAAGAEGGPTVMGFSCGVDSAFTALRHHRGLAGRRNHRIVAGIVMNGFDIRLDQPDAAGMYEGLLAGGRAMLASLGMACIPMSSNFHELPVTWVQAFGTQLASGMSLLGGAFARGLIANNLPYSEPLFPWGSNPLTDPYLGSRHFAVHDDGGERGRSDKLELLTTWPEALAHLRVCYTNPGSHLNCCACEKCIRTILALRIAGCGLPAAFARDVTDEQIRRVRIGKSIGWPLWHEILVGMQRRGLENMSWAQAAQAAARRYRWRCRLDAAKEPFIPLRNALRRIFRGSALSRRERALQASMEQAGAGQDRMAAGRISAKPTISH